MDEATYRRARAAIDAAHAADPAGSERAYADSIEAWLGRLIDDPRPVDRLAARCQHLERWTIPRDSFPMDRPGYLRWRIAVHERQGERARELLVDAGVDPETAATVADAVGKRHRTEPLPQALEDAACLVFLDEQASTFLADKGYDDDKAITIMQRTWRKMSDRARQLALALPLHGRLKDLVARAVG